MSSDAIVDSERVALEGSEIAVPRLWNPDAAAKWSILLTPVFGSILHALNWQALGKLDKAKTNFLVAGLYICFAFANIAFIFVPVLPSGPIGDRLMMMIGLGILVAWYVAVGKPQVEYVAEHFQDRYERRGWLPPIGLAVAGIVAYLAGVFVIVSAFDVVSPDDLAAEIKPLILDEWKRNPELRNPAISNIQLKQTADHAYEGTVDAILNGRPETLALTVMLKDGMIHWSLRPIGGP